MKRTITFILLFHLAFSMNGQFHLSGIVLDEKEKAIDYATVSIYPIADSMNIQGVATEATGTFQISNLKSNQYTVVIQMLGFQDWEKEIDLKGDLYLGKIILKNDTKVLEEINVVAERSTVESRLGKKVLRIEN